jgi:hypothetical protein
MRIVLTALCLAVSAWTLAATPAAARDRYEQRHLDRFAVDFYGAILQPRSRPMPYREPYNMVVRPHDYAPYWASSHRRPQPGHGAGRGHGQPRQGHRAERPHRQHHGRHQALRPINPNVVLNRLHRRHWYQFGAIRLNRGHYYLHARDRHHRPHRLVIDAFTGRVVRVLPLH